VIAEFVVSALDAAGFPKERLRELACVGRSNVGKSSLINALVGRRVARTSAAPGKTRLANFYRVTPDGRQAFHLVDLPGYGYARGGEAAAREFGAITGAYFAARSSTRLAGVLLLVDSRHPGLAADGQAWNWLGHLGVPCQVVATKVDKLSRTDRVRHLKELERLYEGPVTAVSAQTGEGLKELWKTIDALLRQPLTPTEPLPRSPAR
jgi:GTP-binding protein